MRAKEFITEKYSLKFESIDLLSEDDVQQHLHHKFFELVKSGFRSNWPDYMYGRVKSVRFIKESSEYDEIIPIIDNLQVMGVADIKVGQSLSLMYLDVVFATRDIEISGFKIPKKVEAISALHNGQIKQIKFEDGTVWPQTRAATFKGRPLDYTIFFDEDGAEKALTYLIMSKPTDWSVDTHELKEDIKEQESYQPPSINVGDEVRVGKFKNRKAEVKGFKTDKNNQPVLKTTKGDQQLFKPRITKLMKEVDSTPDIEELQISFKELIAAANIVGNLDNRDVWLYQNNENQVYFTVSKNVDGLIILQNNKLRGIKNYSMIPGLVTMLIGFVVHRLKKKVIINKDEPLTPAGIKWLCSLLKAGGRGLTIKDQHGNYPDSEEIYKEWEDAMKSDQIGGDTEITIESHITKKLRTKEENLNEGRSLMPALWFIGGINTI